VPCAKCNTIDLLLMLKVVLIAFWYYIPDRVWHPVDGTGPDLLGPPDGQEEKRLKSP